LNAVEGRELVRLGGHVAKVRTTSQSDGAGPRVPRDGGRRRAAPLPPLRRV
jgi:hypothetical protein